MAKKTTILGGNETARSRKKAPMLPNPFPPDDIYSLIGTASTIGGLATIVYKIIKLWIDDRKARKITIKKGEIEIEIQGGMNEKEIKKIIDNFRKIAKVNNKKDLEIIIPKNCDPSLSRELLLKAKQE